MTNTKLNEALREEFLGRVMEMFNQDGEEVLRVKQNEFCMPVVDAEGNEKWVKVTVAVPTGCRDEDGYDGYGEAESYQIKLKEKAEKEAEKAAAKAKKIAKDEAQRAEQKEA